MFKIVGLHVSEKNITLQKLSAY